MRLHLDSSCLFLLAKENQELVGFACIAKTPRSLLARAISSIWENYSFLIPGSLGLITPAALRLLWRNCPYFSFLASHPKHQGKGIGRTLFAEVLKRLKEQNRSAVVYESKPDNYGIRKFSGEFGFALENKLSSRIFNFEIRSKQL
jgi:GNAT superfamily N-acetyltransferase